MSQDLGREPDQTADAPVGRPPRRRRWRRLLGIGAIVLAVLLIAAIGTGYGFLKRLEGNVETLSIPDASTTGDAEPLNILVMGSDSREGENSEYGSATEIVGQRSDTTILVHLSADRSRALAISIPRDTKLELPPCANASGSGYPVTDKFNSAFSFGGPACTTEVVESLTGASINHVVVVDFEGFKEVVNALGGVRVCLTEATNDPKSGLDLPAGWSTVDGDQALAFVRTRSGLGDGSDISRIQRQQEFLASAVQQATDIGLLANPVKLYQVLDAATRSLAVDEGLNEIGEMQSVALSLIGLDTKNIVFATMPFVDAGDGSNVLVDEAAAEQLWRAVREDLPWPIPPTTSDELGPLTVAPEQVSVQVANGTRRDNGATDTAAELSDLGFVIAGLEIADSRNYSRTFVQYNPADREEARTLAAAVPGSELTQDPQQQAGVVRLIIGRNYAGVQPVAVPEPSSSPSPSTGSGSSATPTQTPREGAYLQPTPITGDTSACAQ